MTTTNKVPHPIYIITGANGFLGNNIVRKLVENPNNQVRALFSSPNRANALQGLNCEIFAGDVANPETLNQIFDIPKGSTTYVIHCAAIVYIKSKPNPEVYKVNILGTKNIIGQTFKNDAKTIDVNSVHAIPELPNNAQMSEIGQFDSNKVEGEYAKSKAEAARLVLDAVKNRGLGTCIVYLLALSAPMILRSAISLS